MTNKIPTFTVPAFPNFETLDFGSVRTLAEYLVLLYLGGAPLNDLYEGEALTTTAFIGWNDFNGQDPYVSFDNALNPDRLLFLDDGNFRYELQEIQDIENESEKDVAYKNYHFRLLEEVAAIPIFSNWQEYFAAKELDIRSMKGFALWTIEKQL